MKILKKISEIFRKIVIGYMFYTFPLTLVAFFIMPKPPGTETEKLMAYLNNIIFSDIIYSIALAQVLVWIWVSILYSISMLIFKENREILIKKLSGVKERDEREVQIIGKAFRASYLTSMAILLFLLFISILHIHMGTILTDKVDPDQPRGTLELGMGLEYNTLVPDAIITQKEGYDSIFEYNGLPLSTPAVILILFVWQIISFRVVSWRAFKLPV